MSGISLPQRALRQKPPVGARFNPNCVLAHGLQALYVFGEGGGTAFAEASGQHPAATIGNGSGSPACWQTGLLGSAVLLNSGNGYVSAGNICDNMASFTVSCWFRFASSFPNATIVGKWGSGGYSSGQGWSVSTFSGQVTVLTQLSGGSTYNQIATTANYDDGKWHHGVFVVSSYVATAIYIDGVKASTSVISSGTVSTTTNTGTLTFGGDAASDWWNGSLDNVAIWNRALKADEIEHLYVEPFYYLSPGGRTLLSAGRVGKSIGPVRTLMPDGIPSQVAHGAQGVAANILPFGTTSQEAFGAPAASTNNSRNLFPAGIATSEAEGAMTLNEGSNPIGIASREAQGEPNIGLNLLPLGLTSSELLGALKAAIATHNPINLPLRRRSAFNKPPIGAMVNASHPLAQGLAAGWILNDGGGFSATELLTGVASGFSGSPSTPAWQSGLFGPAVHFPGSTNAGRIIASSQPAFTDLGLNGPMSVSFWYNYDAAQLALPAGSSVMGKNDSTDGTPGFTHGWVINSDNWHLVSGSPVNSGAQNIKLEFEYSDYNKQGGIPAPTTAGVWHHIVITTAGGASTPSVNDYAIYLDGVLQQNIFFIAGTGTATTSDSGYNFAIGAHPNGTSAFAGCLDTILLYNRVLTSAEAQLLYTDPFCFIRKRKQRIRATHSTTNLTITPLGITSSEQLGALHAAIATIQGLFPGTIVSLESLGADSVIIAVPIGIPANRVLSPEAQYRIFNLKIEERTL